MIKKLREAQHTMQDVHELLKMMHSEITLLRNITYRYYLLNGHKIMPGEVNLPAHIDIDINGGTDSCVCTLQDMQQLGIQGNYETILKQLTKLNE